MQGPPFLFDRERVTAIFYKMVNPARILSSISSCVLGAACVFAVLPALGQVPAQVPSQIPAPEKPAQPAPQVQAPPTLDVLYERLKTAGSPQSAEVVVRQIARRWGRSGSETSDLLMARARQALAARNAALAIELTDRIIVLQPAWAEGWHVRGLAFFLLQDDGRALVDFSETLRREPNHFMALGMAAAALQRQGDEKRALSAFRAVQELHPFFTGVKDVIEKLKLSVDGRDA